MKEKSRYVLGKGEIKTVLDDMTRKVKDDRLEETPEGRGFLKAIFVIKDRLEIPEEAKKDWRR